MSWLYLLDEARLIPPARRKDTRMGWFDSSSTAGEDKIDRLDPEGRGKAYEAKRARAIKAGGIKDATPEERVAALRALKEAEGR